MLHIILYTLCAFFIAIGICDAILLIASLLVGGRTRSKAVLTVYVCDNSEHCEYILRSAGMASKLLGSILCDTVIVVDDCSSPEDSHYCERYCETHENMIYSRGMTALGEVCKSHSKKL